MSRSTTLEIAAEPSTESTRKRTRRVVEQTAASSRPRRTVAKQSADKERDVTNQPAATKTTRSKVAPSMKGGSRSAPVTGKRKKSADDTSVDGDASAPKKTKSRSTGTVKPNGAADLSTEKADAGQNGRSGRSYWLMKAEPESRIVKGEDVKFSIDDLQAANKPEPWDGVRNFVARNNMRAMKKGDYAFFYHSNCKAPGIVGLMEIVKEHSVDETAFDPNHPYYDEKSSRDNPKWDVVHVEFRRKFDKMLPLDTMKEHARPGKPLENMQVLRQSRVSVSKVTPQEFRFILDLLGEKEPEADSQSTATERAPDNVKPESTPDQSGEASEMQGQDGNNSGQENGN